MRQRLSPTVILTMFVACDDTPSADRPDAVDEKDDTGADYANRGPWSAGTAEVRFVGTDGLELTVQMWYPTEDERGSPAVYDELLPGDAWDGAAPACATPRPVVAFSHGYYGSRYQSPYYTEFLASHGYVVVAPDHVGSTFSDATDDFLTLFARRPIDIADTVDWLFTASEDTTSPYAGCVDPAEGYAMSGYSFGGYTALATAGATVNIDDEHPVLGDDRVWAVLGMAPWDGEGAITDGTSAITVPTLILTGARDETTTLPTVRGMWNALTVEPRYLAVFADAGHLSFTPAACAFEDGDGCGDDFIAADVLTPIVQTAATAFLEEVRGVEGAIDELPLDASEAEWTAVP